MRHYIQKSIGGDPGVLWYQEPQDLQAVHPGFFRSDSNTTQPCLNCIYYKLSFFSTKFIKIFYKS